MTALSIIIIVAIGVLACLCAWFGYHWLARRLDRDDRRARGYKK